MIESYGYREVYFYIYLKIILDKLVLRYNLVKMRKYFFRRDISGKGYLR